jgi:ribosomal protein S18 acetylase RimI-like enzyme
MAGGINPPVNISYRVALHGDYDFLFRLHKKAMRESIEDTFGPWDEEWQAAYFRKHFDPSVLQIIQLDGIDVGVLHVQERTEELYIASLEILPEYQRRGIGTEILRQLTAAAQRQLKPVALQVLKTNIAARSLYQRMGFGVTGENDTHYIMARMVR